MLIEARRHHKHSYQQIKGTTLPDVTVEEQHEIACIAHYQRRSLPSLSHEEFAALSDLLANVFRRWLPWCVSLMPWTGAMMGVCNAWLRKMS